jgi:hypothetical protein
MSAIRSIDWEKDVGFAQMLPHIVRGNGELQYVLGQNLNELVKNDILGRVAARRFLQKLLSETNDPKRKQELSQQLQNLEQSLNEPARIIINLEDNDGLRLTYHGDVIDLNSPSYQAYIGQIELTPENFETIANASLVSYSEIMTSLENAQYRYDPNRPREDQHNQQGRTAPWYSHLQHYGGWRYGWNKKDLQQAIANSGLAVERKHPVNIHGDYTITQGIPLSSVNIQSNLSPGLGNEIYLPGIFSKNAYMPRAYYENIYREIYKTHLNLPVENICKNYDTTRAILHREFNIEFPDDVNYKEQCEILRRAISFYNDVNRVRGQALSLEASQINTPLIEQPGSRWVNPESPLFNPKTIVQPNIPLENKEWQEIRNACDNLEATPRGMFVFYARRLGITLAEGEDKASICRKLTRTLDTIWGNR